MDKHPAFSSEQLIAQTLADQRWPSELQPLLRELLEQLSGQEITLNTLAQALAQFIPRHTLDRAEEWQERASRHWLAHGKPLLVEHLANCLINPQSLRQTLASQGCCSRGKPAGR